MVRTAALAVALGLVLTGCRSRPEDRASDASSTTPLPSASVDALRGWWVPPASSGPPAGYFLASDGIRTVEGSTGSRRVIRSSARRGNAIELTLGDGTVVSVVPTPSSLTLQDGPGASRTLRRATELESNALERADLKRLLADKPCEKATRCCYALVTAGRATSAECAAITAVADPGRCVRSKEQYAERGHDLAACKP